MNEGLASRSKSFIAWATTSFHGSRFCLFATEFCFSVLQGKLFNLFPS